jgi:hypothetical protein
MSNINYAAINENFPLPGVDNDTQVFRENFTTIKSNFEFAKNEIEALDTRTAGLILTNTTGGSNFGGRIIFNALLKNTSETAFSAGTNVTGPTEVSYTNGSYQYFSLSGDAVITFTNFPSIGYGRIRLEIASADNTGHVVTFSTSGGVTFKKNSTFPESLTISSSENPVVIDVWKRPGGSAIFMEYKGAFA